MSEKKLNPPPSVKSSDYVKRERWAIIVGISQYKDKSLNLKYADRDAEELYKLIQTPSGGGFSRDKIIKLTNEKATTAKITQALRSFLKKPDREDLVLLYFSCHGAPDPDRPDNVYLITHNTDPNDVAGTALPMREINLSLTENLLAERVIILADTCHSGVIGETQSGFPRNLSSDSELVNRYLEEISKAREGIAILTSAAKDEVSLEDVKWGGGHGVFTHYLLEGMRGQAADHEGFVRIGNLFQYISKKVQVDTQYKQHPLIVSKGDLNLLVATVPNFQEPTQRVSIKSNSVAQIEQPIIQKAETKHGDYINIRCRDYIKIFVRTCNAETFLECPICKSNVKAKNLLRHYDREHPEENFEADRIKKISSPSTFTKLERSNVSILDSIKTFIKDLWLAPFL